MASQALERMLGDVQVPRADGGVLYRTIDTYAGGTTALFGSAKPIEPPKQFGLQNAQQFQYGYSLGNGYKIDFHGPDNNTLTHGHVKDNFGNVIKEYNGYECSMLDPILKNNFKKFP